MKKKRIKKSLAYSKILSDFESAGVAMNSKKSSSLDPKNEDLEDSE
jgi:hypothetical protein